MSNLRRFEVSDDLTNKSTIVEVSVRGNAMTVALPKHQKIRIMQLGGRWFVEFFDDNGVTEVGEVPQHERMMR